MRRIRYLLEIFGSKFPYTAIILRLSRLRPSTGLLKHLGILADSKRIFQCSCRIVQLELGNVVRSASSVSQRERYERLAKRCRLMSYSQFHRLNRSIYRRKIVDLIFTHWQIIFRNLTSYPSYKKLWSGNWGSVQPTTFCSFSPQFQNKDFRDGLAS